MLNTKITKSKKLSAVMEKSRNAIIECVLFSHQLLVTLKNKTDYVGTHYMCIYISYVYLADHA